MSIEQNILTDEQYSKFLFLIETVPAKRASLTGDIVRLCFEFMEDTGLRITEVLHVRKRDIDFKTRILTVTHPKSETKCKCSRWKYKNQYSKAMILDYANPYCKYCNGKGKWKKPQRTTITPRIVPRLQEYCDSLHDDTLLFPTTRQSMWNWGKKAGELAEIDIFQQKDERIFKGIFNHLFRQLCSKRTEKDSKNDDHQRGLVKCKLRHSTKSDPTDRYTAVDINYLLAWEDQTYEYGIYE